MFNLTVLVWLALTILLLAAAIGTLNTGRRARNIAVVRATARIGMRRLNRGDE